MVQLNQKQVCSSKTGYGTRTTYECIYIFFCFSLVKCLSVWYSFHIHACHVLVLLFEKKTDLYMSLEVKKGRSSSLKYRSKGQVADDVFVVVVVVVIIIRCKRNDSMIIHLWFTFSRWQEDQNERIPVQWVRSLLLKKLSSIKRMKLIDLNSNHKSITFSLSLSVFSF